MSGTRSRLLLGTALVSGVLSALSMLAPWARSGHVSRSMFGLISSANALDLLTGVERSAVLAALMALTTSVAVALVAAAWSRPRIEAISLLAPGPILLVAAVLISGTPLDLAWGAIAGSVAGVVGSISAILVLEIGVETPDPRS